MNEPNRDERKFRVGQQSIPPLFSGFDLPSAIDQVAVLGYGGRGNRTHLAGGRILLISEFLSEILG